MSYELPPIEQDPKLAAGAAEACARIARALPPGITPIVVLVRGTRYEHGKAGVAWDTLIENLAECFDGCAAMARARGA